MQVTLSRVNLVEQVKRLDEQINPVVDITAMTLEEYKQYQLKNLSKDCTADIYAGDQVVLYDGHVETFSFNQYDQVDLQSLANIAMMDPTVELTWHPTGNTNYCQFYSGVDIIIIYTTLSMKLFRDTTICNAINILIRNATSKDEVAQYYWGCELPEEDQERVDALITRMQAIVAEIMGRFMPGSDEEEPDGEETDDENTDGNDTTEE